MIWVKITASEKDLESRGYKPLVSGDIYQAEFSPILVNGTRFTSAFYYDVFFGDEYVIKGVWCGRLKVLTIDEVREYQLNELGI